MDTLLIMIFPTTAVWISLQHCFFHPIKKQAFKLLHKSAIATALLLPNTPDRPCIINLQQTLQELITEEVRPLLSNLLAVILKIQHHMAITNTIDFLWLGLCHWIKIRLSR